MSTWRKLALGIVLVGSWLLFGAANVASSPTPEPFPRSVAAAVSPSATRQPDAVTVDLGPGRDIAGFTIRRPQGEIILYRIRAPRGARVRATTQIPGLTTQLAITTGHPSAVGACRAGGRFVTCTTGEEGCPMPVATWRVRIQKLAGPAGSVTIWFRVGTPPASQGV